MVGALGLALQTKCPPIHAAERECFVAWNRPQAMPRSRWTSKRRLAKSGELLSDVIGDDALAQYSHSSVRDRRSYSAELFRFYEGRLI